MVYTKLGKIDTCTLKWQLFSGFHNVSVLFSKSPWSILTITWNAYLWEISFYTYHGVRVHITAGNNFSKDIVILNQMSSWRHWKDKALLNVPGTRHQNPIHTLCSHSLQQSEALSQPAVCVLLYRFHSFIVKWMNNWIMNVHVNIDKHVENESRKMKDKNRNSIWFQIFYL